MTVIYSNFDDIDTRILRYIWEGLDANVIELSNNSKVTYEDIVYNISKEKDTLIFCGHGSSSGLWYPNFGGNAFDKSMIPYIKAKKIIGVWCYASDFAKFNNVKGFFSYMFISNPFEAWQNGIPDVSAESITKSEEIFCRKVNELLKNNVPLSEWKESLKVMINRKNSTRVDHFNYNGLAYFN